LIGNAAASLVAEGFGRDCAELATVARDLRALHAGPELRDLVWRYGIGPEISDLPHNRKAATGCGKRRRFLARDGNWRKSFKWIAKTGSALHGFHVALSAAAATAFSP
jgi:hypothetical protein